MARNGHAKQRLGELHLFGLFKKQQLQQPPPPLPPFSLSSGLFLEKANTLLPWGATVAELSHLASPEIYKHPGTTNLSWSNEQVLGGLLVQIDMTGAAGTNVFYLTRMEKAASVQEEYTELLTELSQILGSPHFTIVDDGYPWARWIWGDVAISLRIGERFTEYVALMVSKGVLRI